MEIKVPHARIAPWKELMVSRYAMRVRSAGGNVRVVCLVRLSRELALDRVRRGGQRNGTQAVVLTAQTKLQPNLFAFRKDLFQRAGEVSPDLDVKHALAHEHAP